MVTPALYLIESSMLRTSTCLLFILGLVIFSWSCKKDKNPFEGGDETPTIKIPISNLDPNSIAGIHQNIFSKTCANSGCHDGTFEPDFRTVDGSYNTLVYQPIIKNDAAGTFTYRVLPGNANASVLMNRITVDIDGNSGIMPLALNPDSDWPANKAAYIENIRTWINNGARDVFGNPATLPNANPQLKGAHSTQGGVKANRIGGGLGSMTVSSSGGTVTLYLAISDDQTAPSALTNNKIRFSTLVDDFSGSTEVNMNVLTTPVSELGFEGIAVDHYHTVTFTPTNHGNVGDQLFFRVYVGDGANPITEMPNNFGASYIKSYYSFKIN